MVHARGSFGAILNLAQCEVNDKNRTDAPYEYPEEELTDIKENITCRVCIVSLGGNPLFFDQRLRWRGAPDTTMRAL